MLQDWEGSFCSILSLTVLDLEVLCCVRECKFVGVRALEPLETPRADVKKVAWSLLTREGTICVPLTPREYSPFARNQY